MCVAVVSNLWHLLEIVQNGLPFFDLLRFSLMYDSDDAGDKIANPIAKQLFFGCRAFHRFVGTDSAKKLHEAISTEALVWKLGLKLQGDDLEGHPPPASKYEKTDIEAIWSADEGSKNCSRAVLKSFLKGGPRRNRTSGRRRP